MAPAMALVAISLCFVYLGYETRWFTIRLAAVPQEYKLRLFPSDRRVAAITLCFSLIPMFLSPVIVKDLFFGMPQPSELFDCDDGVSLMYRKLNQLGIETRPFLGKLSVTGEEYGQSDHVWLLVKIGPWEIPFDWGSIAFGRQYFEGWAITPDKLQEFVEQDYLLRDSLPADNLKSTKTQFSIEIPISNIQNQAADLQIQISSVG